MAERVLTVHSLVGGSLELTLPPPGDRPSFFAFSLHKAGSSLLFGMLREALAAARFPVVDIPAAAFEQGLAEAYLDDSINHAFELNGYAYLGWRLFPFTSRFPHELVRNVLLVRDPRDILVSLYYSLGASHPLPDRGEMAALLGRLRAKAAGTPIDEWMFDETAVRESLFRHWPQMVLTQFRRYRELLPSGTTRTYRYEDVVYRKREWLVDMLGYLGFELPEEVVAAIVARHDVVPEEERPDQHIRQVAPGNHRKHLKTATIERLNDLFAEVLERFDFDDPARFGDQVCFLQEGRRQAAPGRPAPGRPAPRRVAEWHDQEEEFEFVRGLIPLLTPSFLDVGAEKGAFSSLCLAEGMSGVAFEPLVEHLPDLEALAGAGPLTVHPWAIDAEDREATLHVAVDEGGDALGHFHSLQRLDSDPRVTHGRERKVRCRSLESLSREGSIPREIGILKTDTEGNDLRVLRGLGSLRPEVVLCEFFTEGLYRGWPDGDPGGLMSYMETLGYEQVLAFSRCGGRRTTGVAPVAFEREEWGNLVFLHPRVYGAMESLGRSLHHLWPSSGTVSSDAEVTRLRAVCEERLALIERIHREAGELRDELKRLRRQEGS